MTASRTRIYLLVSDGLLVELLKEVVWQLYGAAVRETDAATVEEVAARSPHLVFVSCGLDLDAQIELLGLLRSHPVLEGVALVLASADLHAVRERRRELTELRVELVPMPFELAELEGRLDLLLLGRPHGWMEVDAWSARALLPASGTGSAHGLPRGSFEGRRRSA